MNSVACVTGGTGIVGRHIVRSLLDRGYDVRVLTRKVPVDENSRAVLFEGSLEEQASIHPFLKSCSLFFHCAGEKQDESRMMDVNVRGTEKLLSLLKRSDVKYFCHISSAGVVGKTDRPWVTEETHCNPQNIYEQSKYEAEKLALNGLPGCRTVALRPTNVIDDFQPGALQLPMRSALIDRMKVFLKGGECAHIVHAEDVARAALYLMNAVPADKPECFFVSCDHERFNTYSELWSLYRVIRRKKTIVNLRPVLHLPPIIPYLLRKLLRGTGNRGDIRYSSEKLLSTGFRYQLGIEGAVRRIAAAHHSTVS
ncbi:MAG: NAD-dependent epimerase/dehydratase family protein [Deltaproteobacteria bacterium]